MTLTVSVLHPLSTPIILLSTSSPKKYSRSLTIAWSDFFGKKFALWVIFAPVLDDPSPEIKNASAKFSAKAQPEQPSMHWLPQGHGSSPAGRIAGFHAGDVQLAAIVQTLFVQVFNSSRLNFSRKSLIKAADQGSKYRNFSQSCEFAMRIWSPELSCSRRKIENNFIIEDFWSISLFNCSRSEYLRKENIRAKRLLFQG